MMEAIDEVYHFLDDTPGIYVNWSELVKEYRVSGRQVHDANHVAAMLTHGLTHVLTLDDRDFPRYTGITVVKPKP